MGFIVRNGDWRYKIASYNLRGNSSVTRVLKIILVLWWRRAMERVGNFPL